MVNATGKENASMVSVTTPKSSILVIGALTLDKVKVNFGLRMETLSRALSRTITHMVSAPSTIKMEVCSQET